MAAPDTALGMSRIDPDTEDYREAYLNINQHAERVTELVVDDRGRLAALESKQSGDALALSTLPAAGDTVVTVGGTRIEPGIDARYAAFPGATILSDGRILLAWREGTDHVNAKDGVFRASTSGDNGRTWTASSLMLQLPGIDLRDPSLSTSADRSVVYLTYFKGGASTVADGYFIRSSTDQGQTFGPETRIDANQPYAAGAAPVVPLPNGLLLATWYGKNASTDARESVYVAISPDGGLTWGDRRKLVDGVAAGLDMQEPWITVQGDDVVIAYRHGNSANIGITRSSNGGATWTPGTVAFPGTGRPSILFTSSGTLICVYRQLAAPQHGMMRTSKDLGATWTQPKLLERAAPSWWLYSSPIEVVPGQIFCPTTIEVSLTSAKLSLRYITEGGGVSPYGDIPETGVSRVLQRITSQGPADDFDRPNSPTLGVTPTGAVWTAPAAVRIENGAVVDNTGNVAAGNLSYVNALTGDVDLTGELMWEGNSGVCLVYRLQDANNFCYVTLETVVDGVATAARIYKRIAGVTTQIGTTGAVSAPPAVWHRLRVVANGDYHRLYFEDALVASGTDAALKTMPWVGLKTGTGAGTTTHRARYLNCQRRSGVAN